MTNSTEYAIFIFTKLEPSRRWFFKKEVAEKMAAPFAGEPKPIWLAYTPTLDNPAHLHLDPDLAYRTQTAAPPPPSRRFLARWLTKLNPAPQTASTAPTAENQAAPYIDRLIAQADVIRTLCTLAQAQKARYIALVREVDLGITPESIHYALELAQTRQAAIVRCTQVDGLIPLVVSVVYLERWLATNASPNPAELWTKASDATATVLDLTLAERTVLPGNVRCYANNEREMRGRDFFQTHAAALAECYRLAPEQPGEGRNRLEKILCAYRDQFTAGLETYHIVGTLSDVNELRKKMHTTSKPIVDYFVIATHYVRFLKEYARLSANSQVVDIGCSWGYLGFALANVLNSQGSYVGVEVQAAATHWARERLAWLGQNFRFEHLDIHNDFYNPGGAIKRHQVMLPFLAAHSVDLFFAASVFTHMQSDGVQSYFHEFKRTLRPNGIAAFSIDDSMFFAQGQAEYIALPNTPDELTFYSRNRINEMLNLAGLKPMRPPVNLVQFDRTDYQTWHFATPA